MRAKLLLLLACLLFFFITVIAASFVGLYRVNENTNVIVDREAPFVRSTEEALFSMVQAQFAAERILDLDEVAQQEEQVRLLTDFDEANKRFAMFMAAITWGSETEAFKKSNGGENFRAWMDGKYAGVLIVQESPPLQAEYAGRIDIYYGGYINNIRKAIEERERYILLNETDTKTAEEARALSKDYQVKARRFVDLTAEQLRKMIELSNQTTSESAEALRATQDNVQGITIIVSVIGLLVSVAIGISFAEKIIVEPILMLTKTTNAFGAGDLTARVTVQSSDEFALLGHAFNTMAEKLGTYATGLEKEVTKRTKELKNKVEELDIVNTRLLELDKVKSEFISVAAHQLRTPLSAIKWVLGLLIDEQNDNLTAEQKSWLLKGYESNERMISLINEMLIVTRLESGKERYEFTPIHIEDLIESIILDFSSQAYVRHITLSFNRPKQALLAVTADPDKIRAVLQNLIENAMRYTDDGGKITISVEQVENAVRIAVSDTGIGIPEKQRVNIFNKFFRADNAVKKQTDGSGLGLFISKNIVEGHGGKVWFESVEGKGTTFFFTIPITTRP